MQDRVNHSLPWPASVYSRDVCHVSCFSATAGNADMPGYLNGRHDRLDKSEFTIACQWVFQTEDVAQDSVCRSLFTGLLSPYIWRN